MAITRRTFMESALAADAVLALASALHAQNKQTVRMIMEDIQVDPVFSTSSAAINHATAIYDTLFALDANFLPQLQMVSKWDVFDDKKTYDFTLRDGLKWHDGTPVTAADCVASSRRCRQVEPSGQLLLERAANIAAIDETTFKITLHEPYGLVLETLATTGQPLFMMREQDARVPATDQVTSNIGSGPHRFNVNLTEPSARVNDRKDQYLPRGEAVSGFAGGKVVKVEHLSWENIPNPQTALAALQSGEVDFWWQPVADLYPAIESYPGPVLDTLGQHGSDWLVRMNFLRLPFNNALMRQALLHLIDQQVFLKLFSPDPKLGRTVSLMFGVGSPYSNDVNTAWFKEGVDLAKAKQLITESGYAGEKVMILDPMDWSEANLASQLLANMLQKAGINAELAPMTWSELAVPLGNKEPVEQGGWNLFIATFADFEVRRPMATCLMLMNGEKPGTAGPRTRNTKRCEPNSRIRRHGKSVRNWLERWNVYGGNTSGLSSFARP